MPALFGRFGASKCFFPATSRKCGFLLLNRDRKSLLCSILSCYFTPDLRDHILISVKTSPISCALGGISIIYFPVPTKNLFVLAGHCLSKGYHERSTFFSIPSLTHHLRNYLWALDRLRSLYEVCNARLPSVVLTDRCSSSLPASLHPPVPRI